MSLGTEAAKVGAADEVRLDGQSVVDGGVSREETLSGRLTFEAVHPSLSLSSSTARQRYMCRPPIRQAISSRRQRGVARGGAKLLQAPGDGRSELLGPAPNCLIADLDPALGAEAQADTEVKPDRVSDDIWRKAVALERQGLQAQSPNTAPVTPRCGDKLE